MPSSAPSQREPLHTRRIDCRGYRRQEGIWDIEGHLVDTKTYARHIDYRGAVAPGVPVHEMWLRLRSTTNSSSTRPRRRATARW